jgi:hypothetical protein
MKAAPPNQKDMPRARVDNDANHVAAFVRLFQQTAPSKLIANLATRVEAIEIGGISFPLTVNDAKDGPTCYICCPTAAYIDYALDETRNFSRFPRLKNGLSALINSLTPLVRGSGLDHQVQLNNWLFSTNPAPDIDLSTARAIRERLLRAYPDHAIVIRSLNDIADKDSLRALQSEGFRLLPARQIYLVTDLEKAARTKEMRADRNKLRRTPYRVVRDDDFSEKDYVRCARLYAMLYLDKYTDLNPQYTAKYIRDMHQVGLLQLTGLRDQAGKLAAVSGVFENGRTLTQPIIGYDTSLPKRDALYRMIMAMAQEEARRCNAFFNVSAGAAHFKRRRGAVPAIEYTAIYVRHLPLHRRLAAGVMESALKYIGIPLLKRFEL